MKMQDRLARWDAVKLCIFLLVIVITKQYDNFYSHCITLNGRVLIYLYWYYYNWLIKDQQSEWAPARSSQNPSRVSSRMVPPSNCNGQASHSNGLRTQAQHWSGSQEPSASYSCTCLLSARTWLWSRWRSRCWTPQDATSPIQASVALQTFSEVGSFGPSCHLKMCIIILTL